MYTVKSSSLSGQSLSGCAEDHSANAFGNPVYRNESVESAAARSPQGRWGGVIELLPLASPPGP
jgi:hypothetical protein